MTAWRQAIELSIGDEDVARKIIKETAAAAKQKPSDAVAIVSYDEKPGIQAIATTAPDLSPEPGLHATFARDHEYKRNGTVSLPVGGNSKARDRCRSSSGFLPATAR